MNFRVAFLWWPAGGRCVRGASPLALAVFTTGFGASMCAQSHAARCPACSALLELEGRLPRIRCPYGGAKAVAPESWQSTAGTQGAAEPFTTLEDEFDRSHHLGRRRSPEGRRQSQRRRHGNRTAKAARRSTVAIYDGLTGAPFGTQSWVDQQDRGRDVGAPPRHRHRRARQPVRGCAHRGDPADPI